MSSVTSLLRSSGRSALGGIVSSAGSFGAAVIVARTLGVSGTAAVSIGLWIAFATTTLADFGIAGSLARHIGTIAPEDRAKRSALLAHAWRAQMRAILAAVALTLAFLAVYWPDIVAKYAASPHDGLVFCALVLACVVVHMTNSFAYQYLRGMRAFGAIAGFSVAGAAVQVIAVWAGAHWYGINGALVGYIAFSLPIIWVLRMVLPGHAALPVAERQFMRTYAVRLYVAGIFSPLLWTRADLMIVDQLLDARSVGLFAAASTIAAFLLQGCQMICNALLPEIVHAAREDRSGFAKASALAVRFALLLLIPACLIGAAIAPAAITLVFGAAFAGAGPVAAVLCAAGIGSALTLAVASVLTAGEMNGDLARNGAIGAGVTVAAGFALTLMLGLLGTALARGLSQFAVGAMNLRSANRQVRGLVTAGWLLRVSVAAALGALVSWALVVSLPGAAAIAIATAAFGGGVVYLVAGLVLIPIESGQKTEVARLATRLPARMQRAAGWVLSHK